jgi:hypothetical protein
MSLHDLFTQGGRDRARRRFRMRLARRGLGRPGSPRHGPAAPVRLTARGRRRLAAIDRALAAETPRLASMFAMFNRLAAPEPVGAERLPPRAWPRPRLAQLAFLATLAAIVALSVVLSTQVHTVMRPCLTSATAPSGASSSASPSASTPLSTPASPTAAPAVSLAGGRANGASGASGAAGAAGAAAFVPVRNLNCQAYASTNK